MSSTAKVSISVPDEDLLQWAKERSEKTGVSLSAVFTEAKLTGEALAAVQGATVVDAMVMVSAAFRRDVVYTSDEDDLLRLRDRRFPTTRVLRV